MLLMNLEQRPVVFEDIGRQVLATGSRKRPEFFIQEIGKLSAIFALQKTKFSLKYCLCFVIDKIVKDDINRVARRLLKSPPSVAARGDVRNVPSLADIQAGLLDVQGKMPGARSRLSLFR